MTSQSWQDPRHPDHYHWMTSRLDARGAHATTSRIIAMWMVVGGLAPALIVFGATGPAQWPLRVAGVAVTVVSGLLGILWLRSAWPTKSQSACCAVIGTAMTAVICLLLPSPLLALMGSAVFAAVASYAAIFHSWRLIAFVVSVAVTVIAISAVRLGATEPAVALGLGITNILITIYVTVVVRVLIGLIDTDVFTAAIEPTTGLLSRDGFHDGLAVMLAARGRTEDRYLTVATISLDSFTAVTDLSGTGHARQLRVAVAQMLRDTARRDAVLAHVPDSEFLIADLFTTPDPDPLCARVNAGVKAAAPELTASIGVAVTPLSPLAAHSPVEVADILLEIAGQAVRAARGGGGNRSRVVYMPALPVPDDESHDTF